MQVFRRTWKINKMWQYFDQMIWMRKMQHSLSWARIQQPFETVARGLPALASRVSGPDPTQVDGAHNEAQNNSVIRIRPFPVRVRLHDVTVIGI